MNSKMAWAIWMFQNGRSPSPGKPWQITNRHLLLGQSCQVQLRPKTQQPLCQDSQLRHHTPLQLHLKLKDMAIWPPNLEKCSGEPALNPNLSQSSGALWTQCEIPHHWFQKICLFGHEAQKGQEKTTLKPEILGKWWRFIAIVLDPALLVSNGSDSNF